MKLKDFIYIIIVIALAFVMRAYVFNISIVRQSSMEPTLHNGNILFVSKIGVKKNFHKGSIIILRPKGEKKLLIKRVIATGGDRVDLVEGELLVNGEAQYEEYTSSPQTFPNSPESSWTLNDDEVFVLGDNRPNSVDSRIFGPITLDEIKGKVLFRIYPFEKLINYEQKTNN